MPAATLVDHGRGLTKPKSKLRLRLGLTPPHPVSKSSPKANAKAQAQAKAQARAVSTATVSPSPPTLPPLPQSESTAALATSTSTTASTGISRIDSRSAFTYDDYSPTTASVDGQTASQSQTHSRSPPFETISLNTEAEISRSTLIDSALPPQTFYPTPSATASTSDLGDQVEEVDDDALKHPHLRQMVAASDDIFYLTDKQLGERFCFDQEIGFGNWGSVWRVRPRYSRASQLGHPGEGKGKPGTRLGRVSAAGGGSGAGGKVAIKLVHRERTAVCPSHCPQSQS